MRTDAIGFAGVDPELRIADIGLAALDCWRSTWAGRRHLSGTGGWNWPKLVDGMPHRAAVLPIAMWFGDDLCGLALGYASRQGILGRRHTVVLAFIERRPEPPPVPLRGFVTPLAVAVARSYGAALGARRLILRDPDPNLLHYYETLGFVVASRRRGPLHCVQEING